jgi:hypothetical protein
VARTLNLQVDSTLTADSGPEEHPMTPFDTIESAQQFIELLASEVADTRNQILDDMVAATRVDSSRRLDALHLADYKLQQLASHLVGSARILNDLRMLRRLLLKEHMASGNHDGQGYSERSSSRARSHSNLNDARARERSRNAIRGDHPNVVRVDAPK